MTVKKCFTAITIGGIIGAAVALCITPITLWKMLIGTLTGFAAGYTSYEFKEVWRNIPIAWKASTKGLSVGWENTIDWLKKPHPYLYSLIGIWVIPLYIAIPLTIRIGRHTEDKIIIGILTLILTGLASMIIFLIMLISPMGKGERSLKCILEEDHFYSKETIKKKEKEGYQILPATYRNAYKLVWAGYVETWAGCVKAFKKIPPALKARLKACVKFLPKLAYFLTYGWIILLAKFTWTLVQLIHSHEKVWCGIHSAIGVVIACIIATMTGSQIILSILIGATIGATWGTLCYKILKTIPKLSTA